MKENEFESVEIEIMGINYIFNVKFEHNEVNDWLKLNTVKEPNEFNLVINYGLDYFAKDKKNLEFIQKMAITICVSIIIAKNNGNKDSYKILNIINTIIRSSK